MPRTNRSPRKTAKKAGPRVVVTKDAPRTAEARVKALIESSKPALERAQALVSETGRTLSKQSKAIRKDLAHRVSDIGTRVEKERKSLGRKVEGAVKTTLASLNIPTRSEINLLARRVEELSRKIDGLKRR
jgi:polyhydroxyalkanoate synthesis regulator phasin